MDWRGYEDSGPVGGKETAASWSGGAGTKSVCVCVRERKNECGLVLEGFWCCKGRMDVSMVRWPRDEIHACGDGCCEGVCV